MNVTGTVLVDEILVDPDRSAGSRQDNDQKQDLALAGGVKLSHKKESGRITGKFKLL